MDGVTQSICLTIGSEQTELVEMSDGPDLTLFSASITTRIFATSGETGG